MVIIAMTAIEEIRKYVKDLYPVVRPAVLLTATGEAYNKGSDDTAFRIQRDLLVILEANHEDLA